LLCCCHAARLQAVQQNRLPALCKGSYAEL
jgi:hypothetical protein